MKDVPYYLKLHLKWMRVNNSPHRSMINKKYHIRMFIAFLYQINIHQIENITHNIIREYQEDLSFRFTRFGKVMGVRSQNRNLSDLKSFFRWLLREDYLASDPCIKIEYAKEPEELPRNILTESEMTKILKQPDTNTIKGYRDRVILEVLYSTGIRKGELENIKLSDVNMEEGYLLIRLGKGQKDRVVPLGKIACEMVYNYIIGIRSEIIRKPYKDNDQGYLFPNYKGGKFYHLTTWEVVTYYAKKAGFRKKITPHCFRHTCATHMLKNGANIRHLQEMLGHASIKTTQIYTRVTIGDLKEVHKKYHPREKET